MSDTFTQQFGSLTLLRYSSWMERLTVLRRRTSPGWNSSRVLLARRKSSSPHAKPLTSSRSRPKSSCSHILRLGHMRSKTGSKSAREIHSFYAVIVSLHSSPRLIVCIHCSEFEEPTSQDYPGYDYRQATSHPMFDDADFDAMGALCDLEKHFSRDDHFGLHFPPFSPVLHR